MYSVKDEGLRMLKSWHQETPAGLQAAVEECEMRTHATGRPHIVTDNNGLRLHLSLPKEVKERLKKQARKEASADWYIMLIGVVFVLLAMFWRR